MYIDIHSHILPVLDDGAKSFAQSLNMLKIAHENNVTRIIATPHYKEHRMVHSVDTIDARMRQLREAVAESGMKEIKIYRGTEIYYHRNVVELLNNQVISTLADTSYVLVEFSPKDEYSYIRSGLYELLSAGYRPVIAHIERYESIMRKMERVEELIRMGCYVQVNSGSIMGKFGFHTKLDTGKLLKHHLVHFVASDAHNDVNRAPLLDKCARKLSRKIGDGYVERIFYGNAKKLLNNEYI